MERHELEKIAEDYAVEALEYHIADVGLEDIDSDDLTARLSETIDWCHEVIYTSTAWQVARYHDEFCDGDMYIEGRLDSAISCAAYSVLYTIADRYLAGLLVDLEDYLAGYTTIEDLPKALRLIVEGAK